MMKQEKTGDLKDIENMLKAITHDLITPLTAIRANAEYIGTEDTQLGVRKRTRVIMDKVDQITNMIDSLTEYTRLKDAENELEIVQVDGTEFFEMLVTGYDEQIKGKFLNLKTDVDVEGFYEVNVTLMVDMVDRLVDNAIRHVTPEGKIWLGVIGANKELPEWVIKEYKIEEKSEKGGAYLILQNEGEFEEGAEEIFEPFYQAEHYRNKDTGQGFGLGLSICKEIIERHRGSIKIYSGNIRGTIVLVWIPEYFPDPIKG